MDEIIMKVINIPINMDAEHIRRDIFPEINLREGAVQLFRGERGEGFIICANRHDADIAYSKNFMELEGKYLFIVESSEEQFDECVERRPWEWNYAHGVLGEDASDMGGAVTDDADMDSTIADALGETVGDMVGTLTHAFGEPERKKDGTVTDVAGVNGTVADAVTVDAGMDSSVADAFEETPQGQNGVRMENVPSCMSVAEISLVFEDFNITSADVVRGFTRSGRLNGHVWIKFPSLELARIAVKKKRGMLLRHRKIRLQHFPKKNQS